MPAGAAGMLAACVGEEPGRPAWGPGRQVHGGVRAGQAWMLGISIRTGPEEAREPFALWRPPPRQGIPCGIWWRCSQSPCRHKLGASCLGTRLKGDAEHTGQVENEVSKWIFFDICAPCRPTSILPPGSFTSTARPLQPVSPLPGEGNVPGVASSLNPKARWALGGWWGRSVPPHPLPQPPLFWLTSPQHSWCW